MDPKGFAAKKVSDFFCIRIKKLKLLSLQRSRKSKMLPKVVEKVVKIQVSNIFFSSSRNYEMIRFALFFNV